jgi:hypothetical protein
MAWQKLATKTLTSSSDTIQPDSAFTSKIFNTILTHIINTGGDFRTYYRLGNTTIDTGSNYSQRYNTNGGGDLTNTSLNGMMDWNTTESVQSFNVAYIINISAQEKLGMTWKIGSNTAGAGNAPNRLEVVGKWANTSNQFNILNQTDAVDPKAGSADTDSNLTILGTD